jgi:glycosyltransferase involved in cell wall biosynthesis
MRKALSDGKDKSTILLYVGRLGIEKNLHILKDVLRSFNDSKHQVSLALIGRGPAEENLRQEFAEFPNVKFMGEMTGWSEYIIATSLSEYA